MFPVPSQNNGSVGTGLGGVIPSANAPSNRVAPMELKGEIGMRVGSVQPGFDPDFSFVSAAPTVFSAAARS